MLGGHQNIEQYPNHHRLALSLGSLQGPTVSPQASLQYHTTLQSYSWPLSISTRNATTYHGATWRDSTMPCPHTHTHASNSATTPHPLPQYLSNCYILQIVTLNSHHAIHRNLAIDSSPDYYSTFTFLSKLSCPAVHNRFLTLPATKLHSK